MATNNMKGETMNTATTSVQITARARAFASEGVRENRFLVYTDGDVQVWDSVAGHYTTCHSLSPSVIRRVKKLAAQRQSAQAANMQAEMTKTQQQHDRVTMAQQWLTQFNDSDTANIMTALDKAEIPSDQDWENETTRWTFTDGSIIAISGTELTIE